MTDDVSLTTAVANCAKKFTLQEGRPLLSTEDFGASWKQLTGLPADQKENAATELLALATKFQRMAGPAAAEAIAQLFVLAAGLLEDSERARVLFEQQGVDLRESGKFIGAAEQNLPAGSGRISEGRNLAAWILKSHQDAKK